MAALLFASALAFLTISCYGQEGGEALVPKDSKRELVPAVYVFGDSLIDNGNNNHLPSLAKANYYPYGIDFAGGPTGRFSNGFTIVDEIAELLGLPLIPPHSEASKNDTMHGVNYASAAAGILDITGRNFVGRIPFNQQIRNFEMTLNQITNKSAVADSLFFIGMGSNDYLNNYLMPNYNTRNEYNGEQFSDLLVRQYSQQLVRLYSLGARKFVISGVGSIACIPSILAQNMLTHCSPDVDNLVNPFNSKVKNMVNALNSDHPDSKFIYVDIYDMFMDIIHNPKPYGFSVIDTGCCGIGRNSGQITCLPMQTPCEKRNEYVFWDAFHPTAAVNVIVGRRAFSGDSDVVYPINIQQLAALQLHAA